MRDFVGEKWLAYQGFFEKASEIALYYGFTPIEVPILEQEDLYIRGSGDSTDIVTKELYSLRTKGGDRLALRPEFTPSFMRLYMERGMHNQQQPVMLMSYGPLFRHDNPQKGRYRQLYQFNLEVMGSDKSINDALVIRVLSTILDEVGVKDYTFEINSLGDKDCRTAFKKALVAYYRKHNSALSPRSKELLKTNPLRILDSKEPREIELRDGAPNSIDYLSGASKQHFKEVLEYLESLSIPYKVNNALVRGLDYYTRTVFEVVIYQDAAVDPTNPTPEEAAKQIRIELGGGGRYDYLAKTLGSKRDIPAIGAALGVDRIIETAGTKELMPRIVKPPKVFFIQLGYEAKLKSLIVTEILRNAKVPVMQSLSKDSLGMQLGRAEELKVPYCIIMGQKEVMENAVIVRLMETRSQELVKIADLGAYIKKLK